MSAMTNKQAKRLLFLMDELDRLRSLPARTRITKSLEKEMKKEVREILK